MMIWMDWTDELWEKMEYGEVEGWVIHLTRWVLVCFMRAADALRS